MLAHYSGIASTYFICLFEFYLNLKIKITFSLLIGDAGNDSHNEENRGWEANQTDKDQTDGTGTEIRTINEIRKAEME